jgi:hypothetical protein
MYLSRGTRDATGQTAPPAKWDGTDLWSIDSSGLGTNGVPLFRDDAAYVIGGVLVAHLPDGVPFKFQSNTASFDLSLNKAIVMMRIAEDHKTVSDGILAGVWNVQNALTSIVAFAEQNGICPDRPGYSLVIDSVSRAPDIRLDLIPRPDLTCNAISVAMSFTGGAVKKGPLVLPPEKLPSICDQGDAGPEGGKDGGLDAGKDSGPDAGNDGGVDAAADSGPDAGSPG